MLKDSELNTLMRDVPGCKPPKELPNSVLVQVLPNIIPEPFSRLVEPSFGEPVRLPPGVGLRGTRLGKHHDKNTEDYMYSTYARVCSIQTSLIVCIVV